MPKLSKKLISAYLRTGCKKQIKLYLHSPEERKNLGMPKSDSRRSGLAYVSRAGHDWQNEKVKDLRKTFGFKSIIENPLNDPSKDPIKLDLLPSDLRVITPHNFILEGSFGLVDSVKTQLNIDKLNTQANGKIELAELRPDLIQVLPPRFSNSIINRDGQIEDIQYNDNRLQLRVIDIKMSSEPGAHYFAEVTFYSLALSAWVYKQGLDDQFSVSAFPAVWGGSYADSELVRKHEQWKSIGHEPSEEELSLAFNEDLEEAILEVFIPRLERFFHEELAEIVNTSWDELPYHVNFKCAGCEFLGYPGWNAKQKKTKDIDALCWTQAEQSDELCRINGMSEAMSSHIKGIDPAHTASGLALATPDSALWNEHHTLKRNKYLLHARSSALSTGETVRVPNRAKSVSMPKFPELQIFIFLEYDLSTAITSFMSIKAGWYAKDGSGLINTWPERKSDSAPGFNTADEYTQYVETRDTDAEWRVFSRFLIQLKNILDHVKTEDGANGQSGKDSSSYQIYLWDSAQLNHLKRLAGRHLMSILANPDIRSLAWLFPSTDILPPVENVTRKSPITLVSNVIRTTIALPTPFHYTLLEIAYFYAERNWAERFNSIYYEPLSDLIPMERIHEIWGRKNKWESALEEARGMVRRKLAALQTIVSKLHYDIKDELSSHSAPPVDFDYLKDDLTKNRTPRPALSRLWFEFARLNNAVSELETLSNRSMPLHERESTFKAARLVYRATGDEFDSAVAQISASTGTSLRVTPELRIYKLNQESKYVNFDERTISLIISPNTQEGAKILDFQYFRYLVHECRFTTLEIDEHIPVWVKYTAIHKFVSLADSGALAVDFKAIDRDNGWIALCTKNRVIELLEARGHLDLSANVALDSSHIDAFTRKLRDTLNKIGYPKAVEEFNETPAANALKVVGPIPRRLRADLPVDILWGRFKNNDCSIASFSATAVSDLPTQISQYLDSSQKIALTNSLKSPVSLIWGPPGTGKSTTLRALCVAAVQQADKQSMPLRILVTANNYNAIDNVLLRIKELLPEDLKALIPIYSVSSNYRETRSHSGTNTLKLDRYEPSEEINALIEELDNPTEITLVGAPPQQLHNLATAYDTKGKSGNLMREWFDLVIIDEASQMDVATSTLIFTKMADNPCVVLAGDDLQLPPIHQITPPKGLESYVGNIYSFMKDIHLIEPAALEMNYRSNKDIVNFVKQAGYKSLQCFSDTANLSLNLGTEPLNKDPLTNVDQLLLPEDSTICIVYNDIISGQINDFESTVVCETIKLIMGKLRPSSTKGSSNEDNYTDLQFWNRGVGIVTPHRAQMSNITDKLLQTFPNSTIEVKRSIRSAVDTVERFQGQERDIIFGCFGIGDTDIIRTEEEFLFNLRRFNVMASRAQSKLIVMISQSILDHLASDYDTLKESRLLKVYAESYCANRHILELCGQNISFRTNAPW